MVEAAACLLALALIPTALLVPLPEPEPLPRAYRAAAQARAEGMAEGAAEGAAKRPAALHRALAPAVPVCQPPASAPAAPAQERGEPGLMVAAGAWGEPEPAGAAPASHDLEALPRSRIVELQLALSRRGLYRGAIDGVAGEQTRAALLELESRRCAARRKALEGGRISPELWVELMPAAPL